MHTQLSLKLPSPLHQLSSYSCTHSSVWIKRDDLIHPIISGNKWRKLMGVFAAKADADVRQPMPVVSFGGGYSNHLHALGYLCYTQKRPLTAVVRGNYTGRETPMLQDLQRWHTRIEYVDKATFTALRDDPITRQVRYPNAYVIPEGGFSEHGLTGVADIVNEITSQLPETHHAPTTLVTPVATGTTLAGLVRAAPPHWHIMGLAVLKGQGYLEDNTRALLRSKDGSEAVPNLAKWTINHDYHGGGYAKTPPALRDFLAQWPAQIPLEPVYSGKAMWGMHQLLAQQHFTGAHIIFIHTGGLQGLRH